MKHSAAVGALLAVMGLVSLDAAGATLRGHVQRQTSYGIVAAGYVKVTLRTVSGGRSSPAYTDPQGNYFIYNVPAGSYVLEVWNGQTPATANLLR